MRGMGAACLHRFWGEGKASNEWRGRKVCG
jgi:hypothetical protein